MSTRLILRFNEQPSHALTVAEPWTRWLVETESPSEQGHVIGEEVALRKVTNTLNVITGIEVEQLQSDPTQAQHYLDACDWWLQRSPFSVDRLPVMIVAHNWCGLLVKTDGWRVNGWDLCESTDFTQLQMLVSLSHELKELDIPYTAVSDLSSLESATYLEVLDACSCQSVHDLTPLQNCRKLRELYVDDTKVSDLSALRDMTQLEIFSASSCADLRDLTPLAGCRKLREVHISGTKVSDLSTLQDMTQLENLYAGFCGDLCDLTPLAGCDKLRMLWIPGTKVSDLSTLRSMMQLEDLDAAYCANLRDLTPLSGCRQLRELRIWDTKVRDLSALRSTTHLQVFSASGCTSLRCLTQLAECRQLREIRINNTKVGDLNCLNGLPALQRVYARNTPLSSKPCFDSCPMLSLLDLGETKYAEMSFGGCR